MLKKKVLLITYYWPPSGGAGVQRWLKLVNYIQQQFPIEVFIVTVDPSKASYPLLDHSLTKEIPASLKVFTTDTFEPFNLYKKVSRKDKIPFAGFANDEKVGFLQKVSRFIRGNFFIPDARIGWNRYAYKKACEIIEKENITTVITTSPPHSTQLIGLKLKKKFSVNWIADLRDPWTDIYYYDKMYHTSLAKAIDRKYEKDVLQYADEVLVVSDFIKDQFGKKIIEKSKIHVIPNGYDKEDFALDTRLLNEIFTISYTGTITEDYQIDDFLSAMNVLRNENNDVKFKVRFVGSMPAAVDGQLKQQLGSVFEKQSHVAHADAIKIMCESHVLLLVIPKVENNQGILTGKLFEYMASERPILCIGPTEGDAAKIISQVNAGRTFDYGDKEGILNFLRTHLSAFRTNAIIKTERVNVQIYSRQNQAKVVAGFIK